MNIVERNGRSSENVHSKVAIIFKAPIHNGCRICIKLTSRWISSCVGSHAETIELPRILLILRLHFRIQCQSDRFSVDLCAEQQCGRLILRKISLEMQSEERRHSPMFLNRDRRRNRIDQWKSPRGRDPERHVLPKAHSYLCISNQIMTMFSGSEMYPSNSCFCILRTGSSSIHRRSPVESLHCFGYCPRVALYLPRKGNQSMTFHSWY